MGGLRLATAIGETAPVVGVLRRTHERPTQVGWAGEPAEADALAALMAAVAGDRDRQAFGTLFDHFAPRVSSYLRRLGAEPSVADDLVQEVMLTVWRRADQFDAAKAGVGTWIFTIARNKRIDALRREKRPTFDPTDPAFVPTPEPDAADMVERSERDALLRTAVAALPPEQGRLLHMAFIEDMSHSAIAEAQHLPLGTVKSRIRLAIGKLRRQLETMQ